MIAALMQEHECFDYQVRFREPEPPRRATVILREKRKMSGREKQACRARHFKRRAGGSVAGMHRRGTRALV